jgi:peptide chain release factor 1
VDPYEEVEREFADLGASLADPAVAADQRELARVARRYKELEVVMECLLAVRAAHSDFETAQEMLLDVEGDDRELIREEVSDAAQRITELEDRLTTLLLPKDPNDGKNVIVEVRGAEGGEEANLFARDLFEMYTGFASRRGWRLKTLAAQESDMGGFTDVTFVLEGDGVWSEMKYEGGPHRVQRVPVTESQGRVHTSSATVTVLAEADEIDVHLDEADLQVDVYRSSGPGGQSVNTTDSAVRITHKPSGIVVSMQDEKSQLQNRNKALQVLRARLLKAEQDRQSAELSDQRKGQIGGGGRSEKIRTYNYKENRVTDHRIGLTLYKLDRVLSGELDEVIEALVLDERERVLADSVGANS